MKRWTLHLGVFIVLVLAVLIVKAATASEDPAFRLKAFAADLRVALRNEDEAAVLRIVGESRRVLGESAGTPEVPDVFRRVPESARPMTKEEAKAGFLPYLKQIPGVKWWKIGLDPTKTEHALREAASVLSGCAIAAQAKLEGHEKALVEAQEAADFLIWAQQQGGKGVFGFPAVKSDKSRALQVAAAFLRKAEADGKLGAIVRNGWVVDDLGDGGLQFDNAECGVAMLELYAVTKEEKYLASAVAAGDWAITETIVPNWNYNAFSVWLLARLHGVAGQAKYLDAARKKARLGVYPGQLTDGPRAGRWADPHNARPAYHYILIRGIAALSAALPAGDPERKTAMTALQLALRARNPEFATQGIANKDSALGVLLFVAGLNVADELKGCQIDEALAVLERDVSADYRAGKSPLSPGHWAQFLAWQVGRP